MTGWRFRLLMVVAVGFLAACGSAAGPDAVPDADSNAALVDRLDEIARAVASWRTATSIEFAHQSAEAAANLIVGPEGPGYGDRDGDGVVNGDVDVGLLPGLDGNPDGLANALPSNACVERDVLGGSWEDPAARWGEMLEAIDMWRPNNNTMPTLASHPMRVVGWSTFTIGTTSLDEAHGYAGHAKLHVDISARALDC